nr:reverse transcriptase domain-containing protein [Tanacetum cinerariifolium]
MDKEHSNCQGSTAHVQPPVVPISIPEPDVSRTQPKPTIPYPSRLNDQKLREKATNQMEKFFQIFHDLHFDIGFVDALLLMPKFASTIKSLLTNKDKLFELAKVPLNENCSAMLLKKLPEKLGDPGKFLIPCDFPGIDVCHALADLGASINLMPLSIWKKLSLSELTPTRMTFELVDRFRSRSKSSPNSKEIFLENWSCFNGCVRRGNYPHDVIAIACEEFIQDVLDFQYNSKSSNPTLVSNPTISESDFCKEPIVKSSSPTLTPFGESDFFLEEIKDFLNDESIPTGIENSLYDPEGDILYLEKLLNEDPFQLPPMDLKQAEETKAKSSIEEPRELELKELPSHLEYAFLEDTNKLLVIIVKDLKDVEKEAPIKEDYKPAVQIQRRVNPKIHDEIKKEVIKLLDAGMIYPISDSPWVSSIDCVPKKGGMTVYFQIPIDPQDQEKTTFTFPYGTFAYRRMPFGLCNAPGTFQRCMIAIFHDMIEKTMEVFMDDFSVFGDSFSSCLTNLDKILKRCEDTNLVLNWEKCHFMCREGIFLGHKISKSGIEVDRAKVDVIAKLPHPTIVKRVRSFLGHAGFYRHFIQDFSKIARPMTHLLKKETHFVFSKECVDAFDTLKKKLTEAPILVVPDWDLPFELMSDASDFAIGTVLRQRKTNHFQPIHYASKTMTEAQIHYTETKKEMLVVVYAFEKFRPYLVLSKRPFPSSKGNKYILVEVDYLSKWVEAKLLPTNDDRVVVKFLKSLFSRFGIPRAIISDRRTHFCNDQFTRVMIKYGVTHLLATAYHPQTSGQVKVSNRGLKRILERTVGENGASWSDKLDDALWAFQHRAYWDLKHVNFDLKTAGDHQKLQLNELNELRDQAYKNSVIYKERTKKLHYSKIKNRIFNVGDQVLLFNSHLKIFLEKLKTRWSGPFTITQIFSYGTIELSQPNGPNFKVNGHRVKHYFRGDIPSKVVPDLHMFLMNK